MRKQKHWRTLLEEGGWWRDDYDICYTRSNKDIILWPSIHDLRWSLLINSGGHSELLTSYKTLTAALEAAK